VTEVFREFLTTPSVDIPVVRHAASYRVQL
jgi:hypothetical protein